jgi:hypothetical protein
VIGANVSGPRRADVVAKVRQLEHKRDAGVTAAAERVIKVGVGWIITST